MSLIESLEKRIARLEFWQRVELVMLGTLLSQKAVEILLPLFT